MIEPNDLPTLPAHAQVELINYGRREERARIVDIIEEVREHTYKDRVEIGGMRIACDDILAAIAGEGKEQP